MNLDVICIFQFVKNNKRRRGHIHAHTDMLILTYSYFDDL